MNLGLNYFTKVTVLWHTGIKRVACISVAARSATPRKSQCGMAWPTCGSVTPFRAALQSVVPRRGHGCGTSKCFSRPELAQAGPVALLSCAWIGFLQGGGATVLSPSFSNPPTQNSETLGFLWDFDANLFPRVLHQSPQINPKFLSHLLKFCHFRETLVHKKIENHIQFDVLACE
jgi:hypothetical protein